jgi:UDP-3-O-acyl-N-acetylglucosamine deacetylase
MSQRKLKSIIDYIGVGLPQGEAVKAVRQAAVVSEGE